MARRFSRLNHALKLLQKPGSTAIEAAPTGTFLENYQKYVKGETVVSYTRSTDSLPGEINKVGINPFALAADVGNLVVVAYSKRVADQGSIDVFEEVANHNVYDVTMPRPQGFVPAKAFISLPNGGTSDEPETSQITGLKYRKSNRETYTVPYGKISGKLLESEVRTDMLVVAESVTGARVSFNSEEY